MAVKVFGGAGFVGNHLIRSLAQDGIKPVVVCDIKKPVVTGANVYVPDKGEASWYNQIDFTRCDVTNYRDVYYAIDKGDIVVNLAAIALFAPAKENPNIAASVNVAGAANVMKAALENHAHQVVHISTGSVYSQEAQVPIDETAPLGPGDDNVYGLTKYWGEKLVRIMSSDILPATILRFPHVVGPGKFWGANTIIKLLLEGERPTVFGEGDQVNDFTYVMDCVDAIKLAIQHRKNETYNIGTGVPRTALEFLNIARMHTDRMNIEPLHQPSRGVDFPFQYDINKAKNELNYKPKFTLEEAIERTVKEWYQWV